MKKIKPHNSQVSSNWNRNQIRIIIILRERCVRSTYNGIIMIWSSIENIVMMIWKSNMHDVYLCEDSKAKNTQKKNENENSWKKMQ